MSIFSIKHYFKIFIFVTLYSKKNSFKNDQNFKIWSPDTFKVVVLIEVNFNNSRLKKLHCSNFRENCHVPQGCRVQNGEFLAIFSIFDGFHEHYAINSNNIAQVACDGLTPIFRGWAYFEAIFWPHILIINLI